MMNNKNGIMFTAHTEIKRTLSSVGVDGNTVEVILTMPGVDRHLV